MRVVLWFEVVFLLLGYPDPLSGFNSRYYCKSFEYMSRYNLFKRMNILNYLRNIFNMSGAPFSVG